MLLFADSGSFACELLQFAVGRTNVCRVGNLKVLRAQIDVLDVACSQICQLDRALTLHKLSLANSLAQTAMASTKRIVVVLFIMAFVTMSAVQASEGIEAEAVSLAASDAGVACMSYQ